MLWLAIPLPFACSGDLDILMIDFKLKKVFKQLLIKTQVLLLLCDASFFCTFIFPVFVSTFGQSHT